MSTKHYVDLDGNYLGGFGDGALPPEGAIEREAPVDGRMNYNGTAWVKTQEIIDAEGKLAALKADWLAVRDDTNIPAPLRRLLKGLLIDMIEDRA
jgi:hypothetical protein